MAFPGSSGGVSFVVCTDLAVNAKKAFKNPRPGMQLSRALGGLLTQARYILLAHALDRFGKRLRLIFERPIVLIMEYQVVHRAPANADHRRSAGLTLQRDQSESFLHARMNKKIGGPIIASQFLRLSTISDR